MKFLKSVPQILLIGSVLSVAGVSCSETPSRSEKIERAGSTSGSVDNLNLGGKSLNLRSQTCEGGSDILDLSAVIANIQTGYL